MKVERVVPVPPPPEFALKFTRDEGQAIVLALRQYAWAYRVSAESEAVLSAANELDRELRK